MVKDKKYGFILLFSVFIFTIYSCYDEDVTNLDSSIIFTPEYSVPIGYSGFSMENVVSSLNFDTIAVDTADWDDTLLYQYNNRYYYLPASDFFDTIIYYDFDFSMIEEWIDNAGYIMLRTNIENFIPGEFLIQTEFRDANENIVFTLFDAPGIIAPAFNGGNAKTYLHDTYLTEETFNLLRNVTYVYSYCHLTIQNITTQAHYLPEQRFNIQLGLRVGININSNELPI